LCSTKRESNFKFFIALSKDIAVLPLRNHCRLYLNPLRKARAKYD
jgi:hypothetical protein